MTLRAARPFSFGHDGRIEPRLSAFGNVPSRGLRDGSGRNHNRIIDETRYYGTTVAGALDLKRPNQGVKLPFQPKWE